MYKRIPLIVPNRLNLLGTRAFFFTTYLVTDATMAVNMEKGDFDRALEHMRKESAKLIAPPLPRLF